MKRNGRHFPAWVGFRSDGFTLLEVMVALVIGVVVLGGVMGGISVALQYGARIKQRNAIHPVLEAAAQQILVYPEKLREGAVILEKIKDAPPVDVVARQVVAADGDELPNRSAQLYRVLLQCGGQTLEFSVLAPKSELE
jgi:prepilin-type N-terminal cleavage/methylation domain-containing protein